MGSINWRSVIEILGVGSIVASLIFVGLQLKQSQDIAIAAQYHDRADVHMNLVLAQLEAEYVIPPLRKWLSDDISAGDINTFHWLWVSLDNHYYQYQFGFLAEDSWQAQLRNLENVYANCALRFVWDWRKVGVRSEFTSLVDSLQDPCADAADASRD